jgi:predicted HTH transcriptional regulator
MTTTEFYDLIVQGENERLELRVAVPPPERLARLISAFANGSGGYIAIGVMEPDRVVGVAPDRVEASLRQALDLLTPTPNVELHNITMGGFPLAVVEVDAAPEIIGSNGGYFVRLGATVRPLHPEEIRRRLEEAPDRDQAVADLTEVVARQTETVERQVSANDDLRDEIKKLTSVRRRLGIAGLGAAIGAWVKWLIDYFTT